MTIKEAIDRVNALYPNQYSEEIKVDWLSRLDYQIFNDVILKHEPNLPPPPVLRAESRENPLDIDLSPRPPFPKPKFEPYSEENMAVPLLVPFPYDELYIAYLQMKIDEANHETIQYNNSAVLFNSYYENFTAAYNREHLPINKARYKMWRVL